MKETWVQSLGGKIPWRRTWQPTPVFFSGQSPWTEEPGRPQFTGLQKSWNNLMTKQQQKFNKIYEFISNILSELIS